MSMDNIITIPRYDKVEMLVNNPPRKTLNQIKAASDATHIINGVFFSTGTLALFDNLKVDGKVIIDNRGRTHWGYGWSNPGTFDIFTDPTANIDNFFLTQFPIIRSGQLVNMQQYTQFGGSRGRSAIGVRSDGALVLYCSADGTHGAITMATLQRRMVDAGCVSALNLDGGGSSQLRSPKLNISTTRIVPHFILVWETPANAVWIFLNGERVILDVPAQIINGRTMIPVRGLLERMGAKVTWVAPDVYVRHGDANIMLTINSTIASVNGNQVKLDQPATIINGRTLVPLRFLTENIPGATIRWDEARRSVHVTTCLKQ